MGWYLKITEKFVCYYYYYYFCTNIITVKLFIINLFHVSLNLFYGGILELVHYIYFIGARVGRVFANGLGDQVSIPG